MKTIFISCFHPYTSRNILSTDIYRELVKRDDLRIVLFVHSRKKEYITQTFSAPHLIVEGINLDAPSKRRATLIMKRIAKYCVDSDTVRIQRSLKWRFEKKYFYLGIALLASAVSASSSLRAFLRWLDFRVAQKDRFRSYFETYRPDVVMITDILNERDVELAQNGRYFGVPVIGMVRSWDNLTSHGLIRLVPELLLVPSKEVKRQAKVLNDCPPKSVHVVGIPHYDKYASGPTKIREQFFKEMGLTGSGRVYLYAPIGDFYMPRNTTDSYIISLLSSLDGEVIVRFPPTIPIKDMEHVQPYAKMVFDRPGINFSGKEIGDQELSDEDDSRLVNEIIYSDVVITGPSTVSLDAVFFDKPVVNINFYPDHRTYYTSIEKWYDFHHLKLGVECGAFRVASSKEQFFSLLDEYTKNPSCNAKGRECLRELYCGPRDGKSGKRVAHAVIDFLGLPQTT